MHWSNVSGQDLRNPGAERRFGRRATIAVVAVTAIAVSAAMLAALSSRPNDHRYVFTATYGTQTGVPFTLLLTLPSEPDIQVQWRVIGNATAELATSLYGQVLRVSASSNVSVVAQLATWRDLGTAFTTEGLSEAGHAAVRVNLNSAGAPLSSTLTVVFSKTDPQWTVERSLHGDLVAGWNTVEIRETRFVTPSH
jgi:hypothetical protein